MVATTTDFQLPYQVATDRPCDLPGVWSTMAQTVEEFVKLWASELDVIEPVVAAAQMRYAAAARTVLQNPAVTSIPFAQVDYDTDGMVSLTTSPYQIVPKRSGLYAVTGWLSFVTATGGLPAAVWAYVTTGVAGVTSPSGVSLSNSSDENTTEYVADAFTNQAAVKDVVNVPDGSAFLTNGFGLGIGMSVTSLSLVDAQLAVIRLRDAR